MSRATPGPWHVNAMGQIHGSGKGAIARPYRAEDAKLIAAAPTLLSACETALAALTSEAHHYTCRTEAIVTLRAAIASAKPAQPTSA